MATFKIVVQQGESIELTSGWTELYQAGEDTVFLMPVRVKRIGGFGRHYLLPCGELTGPLGLLVKLVKMPALRKREG